MECKYGNDFLICTIFCIKIETYWNVNDKVRTILGLDKTIKIETYWNVNSFLFFASNHRAVIKIETYWNVNQKVFDDLFGVNND